MIAYIQETFFMLSRFWVETVLNARGTMVNMANIFCSLMDHTFLVLGSWSDTSNMSDRRNKGIRAQPRDYPKNTLLVIREFFCIPENKGKDGHSLNWPNPTLDTCTEGTTLICLQFKLCYSTVYAWKFINLIITD